MIKFFKNKSIKQFTNTKTISITLNFKDKATILLKKNKIIFLLNIKFTKLDLKKIFLHIFNYNVKQINTINLKQKNIFYKQKIIFTLTKKIELNLI